jgi:small subunit ribosomal protein S6
MRPYEITFIVRPDMDGDGLAAVVEKVKGALTGGGGQVTDVNVWGRRTLAYPIHRQTEGQYVFMRAQMSAQAVGGLERDLRLNEQLLRYLVVRVDE